MTRCDYWSWQFLLKVALWRHQIIALVKQHRWTGEGAVTDQRYIHRMVFNRLQVTHSPAGGLPWHDTVPTPTFPQHVPAASNPHYLISSYHPWVYRHSRYGPNFYSIVQSVHVLFLIYTFNIIVNYCPSNNLGIRLKYRQSLTGNLRLSKLQKLYKCMILERRACIKRVSKYYR